MPAGLSANLRHAAALRAGAIHGGNNNNNDKDESHYNLDQRQSHVLNEDSLYDESLGNSHGTNRGGGLFGASSSMLLDPQPYSTATTGPPHIMTTTNPNTTTAAQARRDWQTHGTGLSSALEDKRRRGPCVVRLLGAADRYDASQARYTTYRIQVSNSNANNTSNTSGGSTSVLSSVSTPTMANQATTWTVERRYSDFGKLHELVRHSGLQLVQDNDDLRNAPVVFPGKHWAGRMGNWTPSLTWAPEKHDDLVQYRTTQLDIWLVYLVEWYNNNATATLNQKQQQNQKYADLVAAIWQFLTEPFRPPCQQDVAKITAASESLYDWRWHNPFSFSLTSSLKQATHTVTDMTSGRIPLLQQQQQPYSSSHHQTVYEADRSIPLDLLHAARGLVFMTVLKAGLMVSGRVGTGLVIARLDNSNSNGGYSNNNTRSSSQPAVWSAPCALGTVGIGWGALIGGDVTHYLIVLTTEKAVQDLVSSSSIQMGAELGVAVGPLGRGATGQIATGDWTLHPAYAYAHSQGLFAGISLEGSIVTVRNDVNAKFYACPCNAKELLRQRGPKAAEPLYEALEKAMNVPIPEGSFRPTQFFSPEKGPANPCATTYSGRDYGNPQYAPTYAGGSTASPASAISTPTNASSANSMNYSAASSSQFS